MAGSLNDWIAVQREAADFLLETMRDEAASEDDRRQAAFMLLQSADTVMAATLRYESQRQEAT